MQSSQAHKVSQHSIVQLLQRAQTNCNQTSSPYMPQINFHLKTSQLMSLVKKARRQNKWYHISYCHSMISFPSLPVFWKPEYEINENIDFKPTISSIACWEPCAFDLSAVCFWFPILSRARAPDKENILYLRYAQTWPL